jgi:hypothetical protein
VQVEVAPAWSIRTCTWVWTGRHGIDVLYRERDVRTLIPNPPSDTHTRRVSTADEVRALETVSH